MADRQIRLLIKAEVEKAISNLNRLENQTDENKKSAEQLTSAFKRLVAIAFTGTAARGIIQTAANFESLETSIIQLKGSTEAGQRAFQNFSKVSATTPFKIQQIVEAGITLEAFGANSEDTLKAITDLAAYMRVDVVDAAGAFGRAFAAGAGAADVLRDRGVLTQVKLRTGFDDLSKMTLPQFRQALIDTLTDPDGKIAGATDALSKTFVGKVSNMQDAIDVLQNAIGKRFLDGLGDMAVSVGIAARNTAEFVDNLSSEQIEDMEEFLKTLGLMTAGYFTFNAAVVASNIGLGVFLKRIAVFGAAFEVANTVIRNFSLVQEKVVQARLALAEFDLALEKITPGLILGTEETIQARIDQFKEQLEQIKKTTEGVEFKKGIFTELLLGVGDEGKSLEEILDDMKKYTQGVKEVTSTVVVGNNAVAESNDKVSESNKKSLEDSLRNSAIQGKLSKEQTVSHIRNKVQESSASHIANIFKSVPFPLDIILAAGAQAAIAGIFNRVVSKDSFATGGSFVTNKRTTLPIGNGLVVGDNASGMERVDITPLPAPPRNDRNINIYISAPLVDETVVDHIIPAIRRAEKLGL